MFLVSFKKNELVSWAIIPHLLTLLLYSVQKKKHQIFYLSIRINRIWAVVFIFFFSLKKIYNNATRTSKLLCTKSFIGQASFCTMKFIGWNFLKSSLFINHDYMSKFFMHVWHMTFTSIPVIIAKASCKTNLWFIW